jgi:hypothetical protein
MELRRTNLIQELREAREALLDINLATLAPNLVGNESGPYRVVSVWLNNWEWAFIRFYAFIHGTFSIAMSIKSDVGFS